MIHNHPSGNACSMKDIESLIELNFKLRNFNAIFVSVKERTYVIFIYDREKMLKFMKSPNIDFMDGQYSYAKYVLLDAGYSNFEANLYGIAYMLQQLDTGIAILSKSDDEPIFHQHHTKTLSCDNEGLPIIFETQKCK